MANIEDTITESYLPVNTIAMVRRLEEILVENEVNSFSLLKTEEEQEKYKKCLWLIIQQVYGQWGTINMIDEYLSLCK